MRNNPRKLRRSLIKSTSDALSRLCPEIALYKYYPPFISSIISTHSKHHIPYYHITLQMNLINDRKTLTPHQKLIIINQAISQSPSAFQQLDPKYSLVESQSDTSIQYPYQVYDYRSQNNQSSTTIKPGIKELQSEILTKLISAQNIRFMEKLDEQLKEEEFMVERMIEKAKYDLEIKQIMQKMTINKQRQPLSVEIKLKEQPKQLVNNFMQTSPKYLCTVGTSSRDHPALQPPEESASLKNNKILVKVPNYSITIDNYRYHNEQVPQIAPKIDPESEVIQQDKNVTRKTQMHEHPFCQNNLNTGNIPYIPSSFTNQQFFATFTQLQKQISYMQFLKSEPRTTKRQMRQQKERVKYWLERYWKQASVETGLQQTKIKERGHKKGQATNKLRKSIRNKQQIHQSKSRYGDD